MNRKLVFVLPLVVGLTIGVSSLIGCRSRIEASSDGSSSSEQSIYIGSKAPALTNALLHDARDRQISSYSEGNVYVVVFCATWAPPCTETFSHLVELQQQLDKEGATSEGVDYVLVTSESSAELDAFLSSSSLANRLDGDSERISNRDFLKDLPILIDEDRSLTMQFMEASGAEAIPTAFIVGKSGEIEWIGHPLAIAEPLRAVVEDRWERTIPLPPKSLGSNLAQMMVEVSREVKKILAEASDASPEQSLSQLDALAQEAAGLPARKLIARAKFDIAIKANSERLAQAFEEIADWESDNSQALNELTWALYEHFEATKSWDADLLRSAIKYAERAVSLSPNDGAILDTLAHLLYLDGQLEKALEIQTRASENAGPFKEVIESFLKKLQYEAK